MHTIMQQDKQPHRHTNSQALNQASARSGQKGCPKVADGGLSPVLSGFRVRAI